MSNSSSSTMPQQISHQDAAMMQILSRTTARDDGEKGNLDETAF